MGSGTGGDGPRKPESHLKTIGQHDAEKTKKQLITELRDLRKRLADLETAIGGMRVSSDGQAGHIVELPGSSRRMPPVEDMPAGITRILAERERAYANLRRQFDFTRAITDSLGEGVFCTDHAGRLTFMNPAAKQMLGWSPAELLGKPIHERVHPVHPESTADPSDSCPFLSVLRSGQSVVFDGDVFIRKDGTSFPVSYVATPIRSDGKLIGEVVAFHDVTERKRLESEREHSLERERNARINAEAAQQRLQDLQSVTTIALAHLSREELLTELLMRVRSVLRAENVFILQASTDGAIFETRNAVGQDTDVLWRLRVPREGSLSGRIANQREPIAIDDMAQSEWKSPHVPKTIRSLLGVPLVMQEREIGVLIAVSRTPRRHTREDIEFLQVAGGRIAQAIERTRLFEEQQNARHDADARAAQMEAIFDAMTDAVVLYDLAGNLVTANKAAQALFRIGKRSEIMRRALGERFELLDARDAEGNLVSVDRWPLSRVLRGEVLTPSNSIDMYLTVPERATICLSFSGSPVRDASGEITGAVLVARDVTESRALEQQVLAQAREREEIFQTMTDGVMVYDADGVLRDANEAGKAMFRMDPSRPVPVVQDHLAMGGIDLFDLEGRPLPLDERPTARVLRSEMLTRGNSAEITVRWPDGQKLELSITGGSLRDKQGAITGAVLIVRDVTVRRRLEQEVTATVAELEATFDALTDGIAVYDANNRLIRANTAMRQLLDVKEWSEFVSMPLSERNRALNLRDEFGTALSPEQWPVRRVLHGERLAGPESMVVTIRNGQGANRFLSISGAPVLLQDGTPLGAVLIFRDITTNRLLDRRALRSAQEAAARAAELEAIFGSIADGLLVFDSRGHILRMNTLDRQLVLGDVNATDLPRTIDERAVRAPVFDSQGDPIPRELAPTTRILKGETFGGANALDLLTISATGQRIRINVSGAPIRDTSGEIIGGVVVWRDVTVRHHLEQQLKEHAQELEAIIESIADAVIVYRLDGRIRHMNASAQRVFGFTPDSPDAHRSIEERGRTWQIRDTSGRPLAPEDWPATRILSGERHFGAEAQDFFLRAADGNDILFNVSGAPILDSAGKITEGVLVLRDVTERRQLERRTQDALATLIQMAETLVLPVTEIEVPVAGEDGIVPIVANPVAWRLAVLTRTFLHTSRIAIVALGQDDEYLRVVALMGNSEGNQQVWFRELQDARPSDFFDKGTIARLSRGETVVRDLTVEPFPNRSSHGARQMLFAPLITGDDLIGVLALDVTDHPEPYTDAELGLIGAVARLTALVIERDRLEQEREEVRARMLALSQSNQRMDEFLSIASHELKTPITGLVLSTHLMHTYLEQELQSTQQDEPRDLASLQRTRKVVRRAENQLSRLNRLVDEILDVSRVRVNQLKLRPHGGDLDQLVRQIVRQIRGEHSQRTITLETPGTGPTPIYADLHRIGQVLTNYLTNALKYSDEHEPVAVRLSVERNEALVSVEDHGAGLTADERRQVWERFYRSSRITVKSGSEVGLGLGLYVSRAIIEMHGGRVGVKSRMGKGSTFWFTLPLQSVCCGQNKTQ